MLYLCVAHALYQIAMLCTKSPDFNGLLKRPCRLRPDCDMERASALLADRIAVRVFIFAPGDCCDPCPVSMAMTRI